MSERPASAAPATLLARALRLDPARPFVTYYDLASGGRVELSVATFDNWTNKTAGLLVDELDVEQGDRVSVVLPAHWLGLVWAQAVWTIGARLALDEAGAMVSVRAADEEVSGTGELVVVNTAALGGPSGTATPAGALDYGREVLSFPDQFGPVATDVDDALADLLAQADASAERTRRLVVAERLDASTVCAALLVPLRCGGSTVLVQPGGGPVDPERLAAIASSERAVSPSVGAG